MSSPSNYDPIEDIIQQAEAAVKTRGTLLVPMLEGLLSKMSVDQRRRLRAVVTQDIDLSRAILDAMAKYEMLTTG